MPRTPSAMRRMALLVAMALAACTPSRPSVTAVAPSAQPADGGSCRVGPDGAAAQDRVADRGIGGTGIRPVQEADRGIGGTGIVGVVTGFASICLSGREVAFADDVPLAMDGAPVMPSALRAGQVTAVAASGADGALRARRIDIRHEVSGPVEEIGADGVLRVAGQRVIVTDRTWGTPAKGAAPFAVGEWVAVSGLRAPGGEIDATRVDRRGAGEALVHGLLLRDGPRLRIGALEVRPAVGVPAVPGANVTAVGRLSDGILYADTLEPDLLLIDPIGYFGPGVEMFVVEGYATLSGGHVRFGPRLDLPAPDGLAGFTATRAVAEFRRAGDGGLALTALRQGGGAVGPARDLMPARGQGRFEAAPTADHRFDGRRGAGGLPSGNNGPRATGQGRARPGSGADGDDPGGMPSSGSGQPAFPGGGQGINSGDPGFRHR